MSIPPPLDGPESSVPEGIALIVALGTCIATIVMIGSVVHLLGGNTSVSVLLFSLGCAQFATIVGLIRMRRWAVLITLLSVGSFWLANLLELDILGVAISSPLLLYLLLVMDNLERAPASRPASRS